MSEKPQRIADRISAAFGNRSEMRYHELANAVFPPEAYPSAWRYSSNGGPPGCYMTLAAALRRYGYRSHWEGKQRLVYRPTQEPRP